MWHGSQIVSQLKQIWLFRNVFPLSSILKHTVCFPLDYYNSLGISRFPLAINFLITSRCNLRCAMCNFEPSLETSNRNELSFAEIKEFFERERKRKFHVFFGGGEPFIREDLVDIVTLVKQHGKTCGICTNGLLVSESAAKKLIDLKVEYIMFSLMGPEHIHDAITGQAGSYKKLVNAIKMFTSSRNKTKTIINCAINDMNVTNLSKIINIAEKLRVDVLRYEHLNFITEAELQNHKRVSSGIFPNDGVTASTHIIHEEKKWETFIKAVESLQKEKKNHKLPIYIKPVLNKQELASWYSNDYSVQRNCIFIWKSLYVNASGDVIPCQFLHYPLGNIKTERLEQIWAGEKYRTFRLSLKKGLLPGCARCCKL